MKNKTNNTTMDLVHEGEKASTIAGDEWVSPIPANKLDEQALAKVNGGVIKKKSLLS